MKNERVIREALLDNTVRLIGEGGFERSTTKAIVYDGVSLPGIRLNEVYIYRIFGSKELLYAEVFSRLDMELFATINQMFADFERSELSQRERLYRIFMKLWRFLLGNEIKTRCYVRYFYSAYYKEKSRRNHRKELDATVQKFAVGFKKESNVRALLHASFMTMLDFSIQVYNGELEDNDENAYHIFNLLYNILYPYLEPSLLDK